MSVWKWKKVQEVLHASGVMRRREGEPIRARVRTSDSRLLASECPALDGAIVRNGAIAAKASCSRTKLDLMSTYGT